jgi:hypothetical protein
VSIDSSSRDAGSADINVEATQSATERTLVSNFIWYPTTQISHARRAGEPSLLNDWAMLSGDDMRDLGESKGVVLWRLDRLF